MIRPRSLLAFSCAIILIANFALPTRTWAQKDSKNRPAGNSQASPRQGPAYAGREGLRRGIGETIDWLRRPEHLCLYKPDRYNV